MALVFQKRSPYYQSARCRKLLIRCSPYPGYKVNVCCFAGSPHQPICRSFYYKLMLQILMGVVQTMQLICAPMGKLKLSIPFSMHVIQSHSTLCLPLSNVILTLCLLSNTTSHFSYGLNTFTLISFHNFAQTSFIIFCCTSIDCNLLTCLFLLRLKVSEDRFVFYVKFSKFAIWLANGIL